MTADPVEFYCLQPVSRSTAEILRGLNRDWGFPRQLNANRVLFSEDAEAPAGVLNFQIVNGPVNLQVTTLRPARGLAHRIPGAANCSAASSKQRSPRIMPGASDHFDA